MLAPSNDHVLYAMERGDTGGTWPAGWRPVQLGGPVQSRSPVLPLTVNSTSPVVFLGAQDGNVYTADAALGGPSFPWGPTSIAGTVQAAPAGIFNAYGGGLDYLLVGTRDGGADNAFVILDAMTGGEITRFNNGGAGTGIGIISGMASVDYPTKRAYFASNENLSGSTDTLWSVQLGPPGPIVNLAWKRPLGDIDSSPVLRSDRVYVGSDASFGTVWGIDVATGNLVLDRTFVHGDGQVKGFVWPDRSSADLYFATDTLVWGVSDTGAVSMPNKFASGIALPAGAKPSAVLFVPGSHYVYVGGDDGQLHEIDVSGGVPSIKSKMLGDGKATVGAPSFDWNNNLVHVGTEAGIFYAVEVPLP